MYKRIVDELKHHATFTTFGAATGIIIMIFFYKMPEKISLNLFYVLHPAHVFLSALVTASMYQSYKCRLDRKKCNIWVLLVVGYVGSIGIATLSDSIIPFLGEMLLRLPHTHAHVGFIERPWLINSLAIAGIAVAYFRPTTKLPHSGHVLISTWASLFHVIMAMGGVLRWQLLIPIFIFLFVAVWVPCCVSDIVFPLLFVRKPEEGAEEPEAHAHSSEG